MLHLTAIQWVSCYNALRRCTGSIVASYASPQAKAEFIVKTHAKVPSCVTIIAGLIVITLLAYLRVSGLEFVNYDDPGYVSSNRMVSQGLTGDGIEWAFTTQDQGNWHPLTWLSLMLDVSLFGGVYSSAEHCINLLFHVGSVVLLYLVLRRMTSQDWPSAMVAALFAVHPLHVESVAWVSERKDVLSAFLGPSHRGRLCGIRSDSRACGDIS